MLNLTKMNLYRLVHSKSLYIILIIIMVFCSLSLFMDINTQKTIENKINSSNQTQMEDDYELQYLLDDDLANYKFVTATYEISSFIEGGFIYILSAIVISLFFASEYKNGYSKNIYGMYKNKFIIYLSKYIVSALILAFIFVFSFVFIFLISLIFVKELEIDFTSSFFVNLGLNYLLHLAEFSIITLICTLFKNSKSGIIYGILSVSFLSLIYFIAESLIEYLFKKTVEVSMYFPYGILADLSLNDQVDRVPYTLFISLLYIVITSIGAYFLMNKRDLNK